MTLGGALGFELFEHLFLCIIFVNLLPVFLKLNAIFYKIMINIFNYCFFTKIYNFKLIFYYKTLTIDNKILKFLKISLIFFKVCKY